MTREDPALGAGIGHRLPVPRPPARADAGPRMAERPSRLSPVAHARVGLRVGVTGVASARCVKATLCSRATNRVVPSRIGVNLRHRGRGRDRTDDRGAERRTARAGRMGERSRRACCRGRSFGGPHTGENDGPIKGWGRDRRRRGGDGPGARRARARPAVAGSERGPPGTRRSSPGPRGRPLRRATGARAGCVRSAGMDGAGGAVPAAVDPRRRRFP